MDINQAKIAIDTLIDEKITPIKRQHRTAICAGVIVALMALFWFLYYSPKNKEIKGLKGRLSGLRLEIQKVEETVAKLDQHKAEKKEIEKKFDEASKLLPGEKEIPSLLSNISSQGTNSGLNVLSFKPKSESPQQFYANIPVELQVYGPYHNVGVFLDKVSKLPRIVTVSDITMSSPQKQDDEMHLKTKISLLTYRFIDPQTMQAQQTQQGRRR